MDQPKTRKELKKDQKQKAHPTVYSSKHVRLMENLRQKQGK
jgi:hypothetical protein